MIPVLDTLPVFLSFAEAEWIPPLFIVGSNAVNEKTWQRLPPFRPSSPWHTAGWLNHDAADSLVAAYPGFCRLWAKPSWQKPIIQAVTWLIEAANDMKNWKGRLRFARFPWKCSHGYCSLMTTRWLMRTTL